MLEGRTVVVTGGDQPLGAGLARALRTHGATVVDEVGPGMDALVHAAVEPVALERRALIDVDDERWEAVWEGTMRGTLALLQAAHPHLAGRAGRVVLVTPTLSMSGAPDLVPWTAALEGQRLLARAAARQWGSDGITVNCVAPSSSLVGVDPGDLALSAPALGGPGDPETDLGPIVAWLCSTGSHFLTGVTLCADGGAWMGL